MIRRIQRKRTKGWVELVYSLYYHEDVWAYKLTPAGREALKNG